MVAREGQGHRDESRGQGGSGRGWESRVVLAGGMLLLTWAGGAEIK